MLRASRYQIRGYPRRSWQGEVIHTGVTGYWQGCEQADKRCPEVVHSMISLLADAKAAEYGAKQIVGSEFAGDCIECLLGLAQFFCYQFARL